ncbi:isocitrate lyase/PEP mutase family protein [Ekhidna sp.]|uniref:isocitrate lyase/PEP mutase family protein n=1 Tax=Ekhidna sp. TaxID=2608089 RepID=UPI003C7D63E3
MRKKYLDFLNLHNQSTPLLLGNTWDATSSRLMEKMGFKAIGTSSAAIAAMLGYEDGENMPFQEYLLVIQRISQACQLPLSVDLEAGYGDDSIKVIENIKKLNELGVVGINIEDSIVGNGSRKLVDPNVFTKKIEAIHHGLKREGIDIFINLRIDTFLLNVPNPVEESIRRIDHYENFINGIFLPCITNENDIKKVVQHTSLPLNVMSIPNLPDFDTLGNLGVKRISTRNFLHDFIYQELKDKIHLMTAAGSFRQLFDQTD